MIPSFPHNETVKSSPAAFYENFLKLNIPTIEVITINSHHSFELELQ